MKTESCRCFIYIWYWRSNSLILSNFFWRVENVSNSKIWNYGARFFSIYKTNYTKGTSLTLRMNIKSSQVSIENVALSFHIVLINMYIYSSVNPLIWNFISYVNVEQMTTGRMMPFGTKCPSAEVSTHW